MTCNLVNHEPALRAAFDEVCAEPGHWAIFEYEGNSNILQVGETGENGLEELLDNFDASKVQYGFTTVNSADGKQTKVALIHWQGEAVPAVRLGHTAAHVEEVRRFVRRVNATIYARNTEDLDLQTIPAEKPAPFVPPAPVGSVYKPVKDDLQLAEREKFWQEMRAEEEERRKEEAKRREEQQKQFQLERRLLEKELHDVHLNAAVRAAQQAAAAQPPPKPASKPPPAKKTLVGGRAQMFEEEIAKLASSTPKTPKGPQKFKFEVGVQKNTPIPVNSGAYVENEDDFVPIAEDPSKPRAIATVLPQTVEPPPQKEADEQKEEDVIEKQPEAGKECRAITLWEYQADDETEISFAPNELIFEINQSSDGWWTGRSQSGKVGSFPSNFVRLL
ncbi:Drebrin-like protein [Aphelenchoides fujianensis]|nr:Drebrin-like protein [Aphelenchoides fujianensis]